MRMTSKLDAVDNRAGIQKKYRMKSNELVAREIIQVQTYRRVVQITAQDAVTVRESEQRD
jgi:hypothetical protein